MSAKAVVAELFHLDHKGEPDYRTDEQRKFGVELKPAQVAVQKAQAQGTPGPWMTAEHAKYGAEAVIPAEPGAPTVAARAAVFTEEHAKYGVEAATIGKVPGRTGRTAEHDKYGALNVV